MEKGKRTIDLRKGRMSSDTPSTDSPKSMAESAVSVPPPVNATPTPLPADAPESLEWTALEREETDSGPTWYVVPGGIMALLFGLALYVQNYFFAIFVLIAFAALMLFHTQAPKKINFSISKEGVRAGNALYQFSRIKSFWIFERPGHPELSLETSQTLSPYVRFPLGDSDLRRVRETLLILLPEQQHQEFLLDEIMRIIGF